MVFFLALSGVLLFIAVLPTGRDNPGCWEKFVRYHILCILTFEQNQQTNTLAKKHPSLRSRNELRKGAGQLHWTEITVAHDHANMGLFCDILSVSSIEIFILFSHPLGCCCQPAGALETGCSRKRALEKYPPILVIHVQRSQTNTIRQFRWSIGTVGANGK